MEQPPDSPKVPYRIAFEDEALEEALRLPLAAFVTLRSTLKAGGSKTGTAHSPSAGAPAETLLTEAGVRVVYQRDDATRTLTVLEIQPAPWEE